MVNIGSDQSKSLGADPIFVVILIFYVCIYAI